MNVTKSGRINSPDRKRTIRFALAATIASVIGGYCLLSQPLQLFIIEAGASDIYIGLLNSAMWLGAPCLLIGISAMYKFGKRRSLLYFTAIAPAIIMFPLMFLPYLHHIGYLPESILFAGIFTMVVVRSIFESVGGASWFPMLQDNIPHKAAGKFFGSFRAYSQTVSMVVTMLIAFFVGKHPEWWRFTVIFIIGEVFFLIKMFTFSGCAERPFTEKTIRHNPLEALKSVMKNTSTRTFFIYILAYNLVAFMPNVFFVKFLKTIGCSSSMVIAASAMVPLGAILSLKFWGNLLDRYGNKSVFTISHYGMTLTLFLWSLVGFRSIPSMLAFLAFALWSIFQCANGIAQTRHMFGIVSPDNQSQIVVIHLIISFSVALSSLIGGLVVTVLGDIFGNDIVGLKYRLLFCLSAIISVMPNILIRHLASNNDKSVREVVYITIRPMLTVLGSFLPSNQKDK